MSELKRLKNKESEFLYLKNLKFKNENEFRLFYQSNESEFKLLEEIQRKIKELEWNIKSPKGRAIERLEKVKLSQKFTEKKEIYEYKNLYIQSLNYLYDELRRYDSKENDYIYYLAELLWFLESEPFVDFDFGKHVSEGFKDLLKLNSLKLLKSLELLSRYKRI